MGTENGAMMPPLMTVTGTATSTPTCITSGLFVPEGSKKGTLTVPLTLLEPGAGGAAVVMVNLLKASTAVRTSPMTSSEATAPVVLAAGTVALMTGLFPHAQLLPPAVSATTKLKVSLASLLTLGVYTGKKRAHDASEKRQLRERG